MVAHINSDKIVAGTSPTIKRPQLTQVSSATNQPVNTIPVGSKGTGSAAQTGAPRILLKDVHKMTYLQSDDKSLWYRDGDVYKQIKNCSVKLRNILEFDDSAIPKNCKTCKILIKETQFTSVHRYLPICFYIRMRRSLYSLLQAGKKHLAQKLKFTYRYIDDVLSLKNTKFAEYLEFIYPRELETRGPRATGRSPE